MLKSRLVSVLQQEPRRRTYNGVMAVPHVVRPVDDISQDELDLICTNVREKVYSSCYVSSPRGLQSKTSTVVGQAKLHLNMNCSNP